MPGIEANVLGATGLVGSVLVRQLLSHPRVRTVRTFQRRPAEPGSSLGAPGSARLDIRVVSFDRPERWHDQLVGDVLFSALGTTRRAAGSPERQLKVDRDYPLAAAAAAARQGIGTFILVSSVGADPASRNFYLRMKGEVEEAAAALPFQQLHLLRPGLLDGPRTEARPLEQAALVAGRILARLGAPPRLRPIHAGTVARAMVRLALQAVDPGPGEVGPGGGRVWRHEAADLFRIAGPGPPG